MQVVVAYDISSDRERGRMFDRLLDHGYPVELSVFQVEIEPGDLAGFWQDIARMATGEQDRVIAYPLCEGCHGRRLRSGPPLLPLPERGLLIVDDSVPSPLPESDPDDYSLFARVVERRILWRSWRRVRSNRGAAGGDGVSIARFEADLRDEFITLRRTLLDGTYRPRRLRVARIPKRNGGTRTLAIPSVRDRVVQTAVATVLAPLWEHELSPASFAYRPGRSVASALRRVARLRRADHEFVVVADIDDFFDDIDHARLVRFVGTHVPDPRIVALIERWLATIPGGVGVPQGSPISPLLSNVYLDLFDDHLLRAGFGLVRYADDMVICCRDRAQAEKALARAAELLAELGLAFNPESRITTFDDGFDFLGRTFKGGLLLPGPDARSTGRIRWKLEGGGRRGRGERGGHG